MTSTKEMYLLLPFAGSNKEATLVSRITKANFRYAYYADNNKKKCKTFFCQQVNFLSHIFMYMIFALTMLKKVRDREHMPFLAFLQNYF